MRVACMCLALAAGSAAAQGTPEELARDAVAQLAAAAEAQSSAANRRDRVTALTETVRAYEQGLSALRAGMRQAIRREQVLQTQFEARREEVSQLLGVLASIERAPGPLLLLHPSGPLGTARSGMIVAQITPALQAEAEGLRQDLEELSALNRLQEEGTQTLETALRGAQQARTDLSRAIADRQDLPRPYATDPARMRELLAAARTLDAFVAGLAQVGSAPLTPLDEGAPFPLPVDGVILRRFGEADAAGTARPGILLATAPRSLVTAPFAATIRYVGPLLDYGNVMILEPEAETLLVLAGLGTLYGAEGAIVARGDPLGLMSGPQTAEPGLATVRDTNAGAARSETLYIEVRRGDAPADPAAWFAIDRQE